MLQPLLLVTVELKGTLDEYVLAHFASLVRVVRTEQREGLIRARILGAEEAAAEVTLPLLRTLCEPSSLLAH